MKACSVCGDPNTTARGRCGTCYQYWRRNGDDRPFRLVKRLTEHDIERQIERTERADRIRLVDERWSFRREVAIRTEEAYRDRAERRREGR